jgi:hypothetical protein
MMMRIERSPSVRPAWHNILNLEKELESLFGTDSAADPALGIHRSPLMNVAESEKETVVTMELPGVSRTSRSHSRMAFSLSAANEKSTSFRRGLAGSATNRMKVPSVAPSGWQSRSMPVRSMPS